jgi:hypothetical protein
MSTRVLAPCDENSTRQQHRHVLRSGSTKHEAAYSTHLCLDQLLVVMLLILVVCAAAGLAYLYMSVTSSDTTSTAALTTAKNFIGNCECKLGCLTGKCRWFETTASSRCHSSTGNFKDIFPAASSQSLQLIVQLAGRLVAPIPLPLVTSQERTWNVTMSAIFCAATFDTTAMILVIASPATASSPASSQTLDLTSTSKSFFLE